MDCGLSILYRIQGNAVMRYSITDAATGLPPYDGDFDTDFE
jgi:hypothetical protein